MVTVNCVSICVLLLPTLPWLPVGTCITPLFPCIIHLMRVSATHSSALQGVLVPGLLRMSPMVVLDGEFCINSAAFGGQVP